MFDFRGILRNRLHNWHNSALRDVCLSVGFLVCICIYINLYVFLHPFSWMLKVRSRSRDEQPQRRSRKEHRWQHDLDVSKARYHRRALSYYVQQEQSSFFGKLPLEIRQEIYTYVLCGRVKHFARLDFKDVEHPRDFSLNGLDYRTYDSAYLPFIKRSEKNSANMLALILTCHQIYTEAVDIVYKSPVFKVSRLFTLHDLFVTLPAQRFAAIRHLELNYEFRCGLPMVRNTFVREDADWQRFWTIAATKMPSLRDLKVDLFNLDIPSILSPDPEVRKKWLIPILQVKSISRCHFKLHHVRRWNILVPHEVSPVTPDARSQLDRLEKEIGQALVTSHEGVRNGLLSGESWYDTP
jgi:hypothetical protein